MTLSALFKQRLWTRVQGRRHRVYDLRFEWQDGEPRCTHLVLDARGLMERLDLRPRAPSVLPCDAGLDIRGSEIVRAGSDDTEPRARPRR